MNTKAVELESAVEPKAGSPGATTTEHPEEHETALESLASICSVLAIGLFVMTFVFQNFEIPSASMVKTLLIGDHVLVDRISLAGVFDPASIRRKRFSRRRYLRRLHRRPERRCVPISRRSAADLVSFRRPPPRRPPTCDIQMPRPMPEPPAAGRAWKSAR